MAWNRILPYTILDLHSQPPNIFNILSLFGSISYVFTVKTFETWLYSGYCGGKGEVLWGKVSALESAIDWNRVIP